MSHAGVNMAVTEDGATYNILRRPDDFLAQLASQAPPDTLLPTVDSNKRKLEAAERSGSKSDEEPDSKRFKGYTTQPGPKPFATDPRRVKRPVGDCGMQSMFPGLDQDDSADETSREALAYLRSVRSEASSIPGLLVAAPSTPKIEFEEDEDEGDDLDIGDKNGVVYRDGTWVAVDNMEEYSEDTWSERSREPRPQEQYYCALLRRYEALRITLASIDAREVAALVEANPSEYTRIKPPSTRKEWVKTIESHFPTPACISQISERSVFIGLQYCAQTLASCKTISKKQSCWIWTLLAMAGEKGTLDHFLIGRIRELGSNAGQLGVLLRNGERPTSAQNYNEGNEEDSCTQVEYDEIGVDGTDRPTEHAANKSMASNDEDEDEQVEGDTTTAQEAPQSPTVPSPTDQSAVLGAQLDGADDDEPTNMPGEDSQESANMSISEDEGEVSDAEKDDTTDESSALETARAQLLAQLGDRLIHPSVPEKKGPRHFHQGQFCTDPNCHAEYMKSLQERRKAASETGTESTQHPAFTYPSRMEAEQQRQQMREAKLAKTNAIQNKANRASADPELAPSRTKEGCDEMSDTDTQANMTVDLNTRVTIDMILTIAAERYGQMDLLRYREVW